MSQPSTAPALWRRRGPQVAAAAAAVLIAAAGAAALTQTDQGKPSRSATPTTQGGPISPGGPSLGSCVETYSLTTLPHRETAFDGTVVRVADDKVMFTVNRWYRGGTSSEITLAGATTLSAQTSAGDAISIAPGTRLLVAGDGGFAWSCGFTQAYDPAVADEWKAAMVK
jgi:hypothetical protein